MPTVKANPDYTASAFNLTNDPAVGVALFTLQGKRHLNEELLGLIEESIPVDLKEKRGALLLEIQAAEKEVRELIETHGSYQDVEHGSYAVKQAKHTINYEPALVRENLAPNAAAMVIIEAVNVPALKGLVTGGIIEQSVMEKCGIAKISYAYIIR